MPDTEVNTGADGGNTDTGQSSSEPGTSHQEKLKDYEQQLAKYTELEKAHNQLQESVKTSEAEARRWRSSYQSLQHSTTASLQEAARIRRELEAQQNIRNELAQSRSELAQVREGLEFLATRLVDEDAAKEFGLRQRETQLKQAEEAAKQREAALMNAAQQAQQQQTYQPFVDPDTQKREFLEFYFPGSGVDHNDPGIDWGEGAGDTREAFRRFTTSVMTVRSKSAEAPKQTEADRLLEEFRREREQLKQANADALEEVRTQTRRELEERLRKMGADSGNGASPSQAAVAAATQLNELDESKLITGDPIADRRAQRDYEAQLRKIRNQLLQ